MPTVSITPLTVRKSGRNTKAPTCLGDENSHKKVKAFVPSHLFIGKKTARDNKVCNISDESKLVQPTTPVRCIANALMDEGKDVGLVHKPQEEAVSTLADQKDRETWPTLG